jgi:5-hydroxyisourate hydrolase-like protein (transthyretin family)
MKPMPRLLFLLLILASLNSAARAGTLSGTVINRTTGKPEANVPLDFLSPMANMAQLATVTSDAQGRFSVTNNSIGAGPVLIRATFHNVSFNIFAPPNRPQIDVEVFEISKDPKTINIPSHVIIFEPQGAKLVGAEEYEVQNASQPPVAFFRTEGNFDFAIPDGGELGQVSTTGSSGMAIPQASIDKGKGHYAIAYAFRPGQTNVRLSYGLSYANNSATVKLPVTYAGGKILVVVPPGITVAGDGLTAAGQEQGMMVFTHDPLPAKGTLTVDLSGIATAQPASDDQSAAQEGNSRQGPEVIAAPARLDDFKWYIFAGLAALFAMGAVLVSRKQVVVASSPAENTPVAKTAKPVEKPKKAPPAVAPAANRSAEVEQSVKMNMDVLRDQIFRLELRRQAGTISEEDYAREKDNFDKLLRDMVQG